MAKTYFLTALGSINLSTFILDYQLEAIFLPYGSALNMTISKTRIAFEFGKFLVSAGINVLV